jgi:hypothetical protein
MFSLKPSFNGYESSTFCEKYVIKCDAIGNILRNTLGTWGTWVRIHIGNMVGIPKSKELQLPSSLPTSFDFLGMFSK